MKQTKSDLLTLTKERHPYADDETCIFALVMFHFHNSFDFTEQTTINIEMALKVWDMITPDSEYCDNWQIPQYRYMLQCMKQLGKQLPTEDDIHNYRQKGMLLDIDSEMVTDLINDGLIAVSHPATAPLEINCVVTVYGGKEVCVKQTFNDRSKAIKESVDNYNELLHAYILYYTAHCIKIQQDYASNMYNLAMKHLINIGVDAMDYLIIYQNMLAANKNEYDFMERVVADCLIILDSIKNNVIMTLTNNR